MQWPHGLIMKEAHPPESGKNSSKPGISAYLVPLVSIFQGEQKSLWDPGAEMKPCSARGGQS